MRIISDFKDYYDSGLGLGHDTNCTYVRKTEILCGETLSDKRDVPEEYSPTIRNIDPRIFWLENSMRIYLSPISVYFCGDIHRALEISCKKESAHAFLGELVESKILYSLEEVITFLSKRRYYKLNPSNPPYLLYQGDDLLQRSDFLRKLEIMFTPFNFIEGSKSFKDKMISNRVVSAAIIQKAGDRSCHFTRVTINPKLSDYEFYRVHPAPQTYQEIEMFISGVLGEANKEPINISDKDRIYQHGFNERSFRKDPSPSKGRRKAKAA